MCLFLHFRSVDDRRGICRTRQPPLLSSWSPKEKLRWHEQIQLRHKFRGETEDSVWRGWGNETSCYYEGAVQILPHPVYAWMSRSKGLIIPPNSNTFSDWRRICHVPWITKIKETTPWTFDSQVIRSCPLKPRKFVVPAGFKQIIFPHCFVIFELGGITKHLWLASRSNSEFC